MNALILSDTNNETVFVADTANKQLEACQLGADWETYLMLQKEFFFQAWVHHVTYYFTYYCCLEAYVLDHLVPVEPRLGPS